MFFTVAVKSHYSEVICLNGLLYVGSGYFVASFYPLVSLGLLAGYRDLLRVQSFRHTSYIRPNTNA